MPADVLAEVLRDLDAESADLDSIVARLPAADWQRPTPAAGWTLAMQIGHLNWTDEIAALAVTDPDVFGRAVAELAIDVAGIVDRIAAQRADASPTALLESWRSGRQALSAALRHADPASGVPWFGPPMRPASMATARLMETWAHGQDVADTLGVRRTATARLRHVAHLGVRTRDFAYALHDRTPPADPFRVELTAPDGDVWSWGPADADQRVDGPALDFCLLVTQRRSREDLAVTATGAEASAWLDIAQAFAGPAGSGRPAALG